MADPKEIYYLLEKLCASIAGEKHKHEVNKKVTTFLSVLPITLKKFPTDVSLRLVNLFSPPLCTHRSYVAAIAH